jgi:hypothetical protein
MPWSMGLGSCGPGAAGAGETGPSLRFGLKRLRAAMTDQPPGVSWAPRVGGGAEPAGGPAWVGRGRAAGAGWTSPQTM